MPQKEGSNHRGSRTDSGATRTAGTCSRPGRYTPARAGSRMYRGTGRRRPARRWGRPRSCCRCRRGRRSTAPPGRSRTPLADSGKSAAAASSASCSAASSSPRRLGAPSIRPARQPNPPPIGRTDAASRDQTERLPSGSVSHGETNLRHGRPRITRVTSNDAGTDHRLR